MIIHHTSSAEMIARMKFVRKVKVQIHHLGADLLRGEFFRVPELSEKNDLQVGCIFFT